MKLKYYLRGLGIGIVVTAVLMGAATKGGESLSDAQIKERALKLGMVESSSLTLSDLQTGEKEPTGQKTTPAPEQPLMPSPAVTDPAQPEKQPVEQPPEETLQSAEEETSVSTVTVTVERGDSSFSVSKMLAEAGLVEEAGAFDRYLCDNGYSKSISIGTYEIAHGTSEEEIAKIITGKR